jgi:hypothetical protein
MLNISYGIKFTISGILKAQGSKGFKRFHLPLQAAHD